MKKDRTPLVEPTPPDRGRDRVARQLGLALKASHIYPPGHDRVAAARSELADACTERLGSGGPFLVEGRVDRSGTEDRGAPALDPAVAYLADEMQKRGVRAVRFEPTLRTADLDGLISLLGEEPLELAARGGAVQSSESLTGLTIVGYQFHIDRRSMPTRTSNSSPWDLSDLVVAEPPAPCAPDLATIRAMPEVQVELDRLQESLRATKENPEEGKRTVESIMRIVLDRVSGAYGDESEDAEDTAQASEAELWDMESTAGEEDRHQIDDVADRIYGIVLARMALDTQGEQAEWAPSSDEPDVQLVDLRMLKRTCQAIGALPAEPQRKAGESIADSRDLQLAESAVNLVPICENDASRKAVLERLQRNLKAEEVQQDRLAILGRFADLLLAEDLPREVVVEILDGLRRAAPSEEIPQALLGRLPHHTIGGVRRLAERLDDTALGKILDVFLEREGQPRSAALQLLRAAPSRILPRLLEGSRDPDPRRRLRVLETARALEDGEVNEVIIRLAGDVDERVRLGALRALAFRADAECRAAFETTLEESSPELWQTLAHLVQGSGDLRVPRVLERIARGDGSNRHPLKDRLTAVRILGEFPGPASRHRIVGLARYFRIREPVATFLVRREAKRMLRATAYRGTTGGDA